MLWQTLAFIIGGVLLQGKGKKENNGTMKVVGIILMIVGIVLLLAVIAFMVFAGIGIAKEV